MYVESYRGSRREPAGLCRLRKQVTEAGEGPLERRREKGKSDAPGGKERGQGRHGCAPARDSRRSDFKNEKPAVTGF